MLSRARHKVVADSDITRPLILYTWPCMNVYGQLRVPSQVGELMTDRPEKKVLTLKICCDLLTVQTRIWFQNTAQHRTTTTELFSCSNIRLDFTYKAAYNPWRDLNHFVSALPCCMSQKLMNFRERGRSVKNSYFSEITRKILCVLTA
jgi:hypothetical protein